MQPDSALRRLADTLLEGGLDDFVESRRRDGKSWRLICRDLREATNGEIDITEVTLRGWHAASVGRTAAAS